GRRREAPGLTPKERWECALARPVFRLVACVALLWAVGAGAGVAAKTGADDLEPAVVVNQRVMPAVVQIVTEIDYEVRRVAYVESRIQPGVFIREVGDWERQQARVAGSGTVIFS